MDSLLSTRTPRSFSREFLQQVSSHPILVPGVFPPQVQDHAFTFDEFQMVHLWPSLQSVEVLLKDSTALWGMGDYSQLCVPTYSPHALHIEPRCCSVMESGDRDCHGWTLSL